MAITSKFFKVTGVTAKLRELELGDVVYWEVQPNVTYTDAMKTVTSLCDRVGKRFKQTAMKALPTSVDDNTVRSIIRIECIG